MNKAIVTGATGMLGLALIRKLIKEEYKVYAVVRPDSKRVQDIPKDKNITIIPCDLSELETLPDKIADSCDLFFHFAWDGTYGDEYTDKEY